MSPGVPPAVASTLPAGFRFGKPAARVEESSRSWLASIEARASLRGAYGPAARVVELTGIEPVASWLQTRRSPR